MIEKLFRLLEEQRTGHGKFIKFTNMKFERLQAVYASPEQIYGVAVFGTEEEMQEGWEHAAEELSIQVQGQLKGRLTSLRWDMYLLLFVTDSNVRENVRKLIENDRMFFRKIVLTADDNLEECLPFSFLSPTEGGLRGLTLFGEEQFLQEFKTKLSSKAVERLGAKFFAHGAEDWQTLKALLGDETLAGGGDGENQRD
ncbi:hypothetical protein JJB07_23340 [Tumebacillus sp. ITR2]|uniref:Uncharacterized protein n=1 Tax=Tumebacillus amylolyticus TaxID=2801339 RepID=A0ABS1JGR7_9BACL|nr:ABC-three component system middle component 1 [Tumebacillus amylolyticus]MBL0389484.1 hypothetical protein [Tumebacillus amylolyticus]